MPRRRDAHRQPQRKRLDRTRNSPTDSSTTLGPEGILQFKTIVNSGKFSTGAGTYEIFEDIFSFYRDDIVSRGKVARPIKVVLAAQATAPPDASRLRPCAPSAAT